ncbi:cobalamin biosynthesis protein [Rhizobium tumorigenes]|uniref:cobalamin biosynthesis protein n=1 Tax=Rhizobium tumorigenes TaxID=2041385 RepID=UPI00241CE304|nr:cobalamin biosynthesis protein [Rhizobium tumorigenes]WFS02832.1 cobalamin biosynthesis protein [Rhizobium tumorigenes]
MSRLVIGMGCESGAPEGELLALAKRALAGAALDARDLQALASIDGKAKEPAILAVAAYYGIPALFFDAERLERETPRLQNPSDKIFALVGCHGVAEAAALAGAGPEAVLIVPKLKSALATVAIAVVV